MQKNLLLLQDLYCKNLIKQWACIHLFTPVSELLQDEAICVEMNQAVKVAQLPEVTLILLPLKVKITPACF